MIVKTSSKITQTTQNEVEKVVLVISKVVAGDFTNYTLVALNQIGTTSFTVPLIQGEKSVLYLLNLQFKF